MIKKERESSFKCSWFKSILFRGSLHDLLHHSFMEISPALKLKFAQGTALGCHYLINYDPPVYHCDLKAKNLLV